MRKPGEKGAPTPAQLKRAKGEETIKEMPYYRKIYDKIHQMTHPKGYDKILKMYIQMHKQGHRNPAQALGQMIKGVEALSAECFLTAERLGIQPEIATSLTKSLRVWTG